MGIIDTVVDYFSNEKQRKKDRKELKEMREQKEQKIEKNYNQNLPPLIEYPKIIPSKNEFQEEKISSIPELYNDLQNFNVNLVTNQKTIGNKKYFKPRERNILSENSSYKQINKCFTEQISHLNTNIICSKNINKKYTKISTTTRYRFKQTTFVYYKANLK